MLLLYRNDKFISLLLAMALESAMSRTAFANKILPIPTSQVRMDGIVEVKVEKRNRKKIFLANKTTTLIAVSDPMTLGI